MAARGAPDLIAADSVNRCGELGLPHSCLLSNLQLEAGRRTKRALSQAACPFSATSVAVGAADPDENTSLTLRDPKTWGLRDICTSYALPMDFLLLGILELRGAKRTVPRRNVVAQQVNAA